MPCHEFLVIPFHDGWIVEHEHDRLGPYQNEPAALQVAIAEALQLRQQGMRTKASVKDCAGNTCAEYCLCKEFKIAPDLIALGDFTSAARSRRARYLQSAAPIFT